MSAQHAGTQFDGFLVVAIDFESTGFSPARDRVVQVGAVAQHSGKPLFELNELVYTPVQIKAKAQEITGISNENLRGKPDFGQVFQQLLGKIDETTRTLDVKGKSCSTTPASSRVLHARQDSKPKVLLVAHNGERFDFRMLIYEMSRHGIDLQTLRERDVYLYDTYAAACKVNGRKAGTNTLSALFQQVVGTQMQGAHDALADCRALVKIAGHPPFLQKAKISSLGEWLSSQTSPFRGLDLFCQECKGNVWDNREYNATASTKRPDLRCQEKFCKWHLWKFKPPADLLSGAKAGSFDAPELPAPELEKHATGVSSSKSGSDTKSFLPEGEVIDLDRHKFKVGKLAANGAMSSLYFGICIDGKSKGRQVILKLQPRARSTKYQITTEHHILSKIKQISNPKLRTQELVAYGCHKERCYVLVTGLLGPDLLRLGDNGGKHSARNVLVLAHQALVLFEQLHSANLLHRDVKPENLVLGCEGAADALKLHMIDFGTSESLVDRHGARRTQKQAAEGSVPYMAVTVHEKQPLGKRDDIESLIWTLLRLCLGKLPWENGKVTLAGMVQRKKRMKEVGVEAEETCKDMAPYMATCMSKMLAHVQELQKPESEPDYCALRLLVEAAWKSGGFAPREVSKAEVSY